MTITAQDFIKGRLDSTDLPTCAIVAHPTQANRWRLIPVSPFDSEQLSTVSYLFDDATPYDDGAEISVPAEYPAAAPTAAEREWLTRPCTLERMLEQVLIDQQMIANVQSIGMGLGHPNNLVIKFSGPAPVVPSGAKKTDLAQAGLVEIKQGGSPGTWMIRVSDQWRIDLQAGDQLRQLRAEVKDLKARLAEALDEARDAQDSEAVTLAKLETARAQRDDAEKMVVELRRERDQLEAQITTPSMPKWAPLRGEIGYTMPRGCKLHIATSLAILNDLMGQGGKLIGQPEIHSATELYALVEMRDGVPARLPNYAGRVTIVDAKRPLMSRAARVAADNAEVIDAIRSTPRSPRPVSNPLIGVTNG
jgi:hypothetical protein